MDKIIYRDRSSWYYLDLEDYEYSIRQEITSDRVNYNRNRRKRKAAERINRRNKRIYFAIQKLIGLLLIVGAVLTAYTLKGTDITYAIVVVPIGLLMVFSRERVLAIGRRNKRNRGHAGA